VDPVIDSLLQEDELRNVVCGDMHDGLKIQLVRLTVYELLSGFIS
jgi:hypothetical protein